MKRYFTYSHRERSNAPPKREKYLRIWKVLSLVPTGKSKIIGCFWKIFCFTKDPFTHLDKGGRNAHPFLRFSKKNFYSVKISPHLFGITKPNDTLFRRKKWENIFSVAGALFCLLRKTPSFIPTGNRQIPTLFQKIFCCLQNPFTYLELRSRNAPCFYKNFEKYFLIEGLDFACSKSPFTYSHWEQPNAPPKSQKNFIPSFIWNWDAKTQPVFQEKQKKFFEKTAYLKNIPSFVPIGRGHLGIVIQKKSKKICPPGVAGIYVFIENNDSDCLL